MPLILTWQTNYALIKIKGHKKSGWKNTGRGYLRDEHIDFHRMG
jgi:hypothetical protein